MTALTDEMLKELVPNEVFGWSLGLGGMDDALLAYGRAVAEAAVPDGFLLVPKVATREIEDAIARSRNLKVTEIWEDALAASQPAGGGVVNTDQIAEKLGRYIIVSNYEAYSIIEKLIRDAAQAERDRIYAALEADPSALWRDQGFQDWRRNRGADSVK